MTQKKLILASASPRRRELLSRLTDDFEIIVCKDEEHSEEGAPHLYVMDLAAHKAAAVAAMTREPALVIGSDTVVVLDGKILGKPSDPQEAVEMLGQLAGRTHHVLTGVALYDTTDGHCTRFYEETSVTMDSVSEKEIQEYVKTGEPMDKAGAYAIQGIASKFIISLSGNYDNVVGLPICGLRRKLIEEGFTV